MGNAWSKDFGIAHLFLFCSRCDSIHHLLPKWSQAKESDGKGFSMCNSTVKMPDLFKNLLGKLSKKREEEGSRHEGRNVNINIFWLFDAWILNIHVSSSKTQKLSTVSKTHLKRLSIV